MLPPEDRSISKLYSFPKRLALELSRAAKQRRLGRIVRPRELIYQAFMYAIHWRFARRHVRDEAVVLQKKYSGPKIRVFVGVVLETRLRCESDERIAFLDKESSDTSALRAGKVSAHLSDDFWKARLDIPPQFHSLFSRLLFSADIRVLVRDVVSCCSGSGSNQKSESEREYVHTGPNLDLEDIQQACLVPLVMYANLN